MAGVARIDTDGTAVVAAAAGTGSYPKPHVLLTAAELVRVPIEYGSSWVLDRVAPARARPGHPVLVLPAFYATDGLTALLRAHLVSHGYAAHGWGLGRNIGLTERILDGVVARLDELSRRYQVPVSLVGWSFGGLLARWLAHQRAEQVRQVICLGSPWRPEGEASRATAMFRRTAARHGMVGNAAEVMATLRAPLPVPCTAIYSRTDGITSWRGCRVDADARCANIVVPSSHVGLVANPLALAAVVDRLAQEPDDIAPFSWRVALSRSVFARRPRAYAFPTAPAFRPRGAGPIRSSRTRPTRAPR
jgi:pimeloyl-ACP methyl ester carboxylesterase